MGTMIHHFNKTGRVMFFLALGLVVALLCAKPCTAGTYTSRLRRRLIMAGVGATQYRHNVIHRVHRRAISEKEKKAFEAKAKKRADKAARVAEREKAKEENRAAQARAKKASRAAKAEMQRAAKEAKRALRAAKQERKQRERALKELAKRPQTPETSRS